MSDRFTEIAAVTGAAGALGRASAVGLAHEGAKVLLFDRDEAGLKADRRAVPGSVPVVGDATKPADVERAAAVARKQLGPVELLVAAAGMVGPSKIRHRGR